MLKTKFDLADLPEDAPILISESRGVVAAQLARAIFTPAATIGLLDAHTQFLDSGCWFQLWKGEIVSLSSPDDPKPQMYHPDPVAAAAIAGATRHGKARLTVTYEKTDLPAGQLATYSQSRGKVTFHLAPCCFVPEGPTEKGLSAFGAAGQALLDGGQWFQVWEGEIITAYE
jgi:hypothetical protein